MSTLKKNVLALALVAGLGLAGQAAAYTVTTDGDTEPVRVATADIADANTAIGVTEGTTITLEGGDFILGRTTGFTIRIQLENGASFDGALEPGDLTLGPAAASWALTVAAGGTENDSFVVINVDPTTSSGALTTGDLLTINAAPTVTGATTGLVLDNLTALQTDGGTVSATVRFVDPVTAQQIMNLERVTLLQSGDPAVLACDTSGGDQTKRIDVGGNASHPPKTYFSTYGAIGMPDSGYINLGEVTVSVATGFGSGFAYAGTDAFTTVLTGWFNAFAPSETGRGVFLSLDQDCATQDVVGTVSSAGDSVTFEYEGSELGSTAAGFSAYVCAQVPTDNTEVIEASPVSAVTTFTRGEVSSAGASCPLLPLRYNGSVVEVYHVNPAGNTTAQSFLRIINPSTLTGKVTVDGVDDAGAAGDQSVTFTLPAGRSMQVNSEDLENGNPAKGLSGAWGDGTGKWRAVVTGEFPGMVVQSMNRNSSDGTVTNLTDADNRGEQVLNSIYDNN